MTKDDRTGSGIETTVDKATMENKIPVAPGRLGVRHFQIFLMFICLTVAYAKRVNLSVAIVAMVDRNSANPDYEEFDWDQQTQSTVLSSFFWGYVFTQIPAGQLAERYGPKMIIFYAMMISSLLTLLTPICSSIGGWELLCAIRVVEGLCQGVIYPSTHTLLSKWAPPLERGQLGTYCYAGSQFGTVIMLSCSGALASSSMGWPSIFYFSGAVGTLWSILWFFFGSNSPSEYKRISPEEKDFIEMSIKPSDDATQTKCRAPTPWLKILTSVPFISLFIVHAAQNWGYWTLLTKIPVYMKFILGFDIKSNALLSALPYLAMLIMCFVFSWFGDILIKKNIVPLKYSRKLFNSIGHWVPMLALIGLAFVAHGQQVLAVALLTLAVGFNAATFLGYQVNHIDLAPNYAGTMMGITNGGANVVSIFAPLVVGFIVTEETDSEQWKIVFLIAALVYFVGNLIFVIFSKSEVQSWNEPKKDDENRTPDDPETL